MLGILDGITLRCEAPCRHFRMLLTCLASVLGMPVWQPKSLLTLPNILQNATFPGVANHRSGAQERARLKVRSSWATTGISIEVLGKVFGWQCEKKEGKRKTHITQGFCMLGSRVQDIILKVPVRN